MNISARIDSAPGQHQATVQTEGRQKDLAIPPKTDGSGSSVNGGELLFLALATCYCNDLYREAARRGLAIEGASVEVSGEFGGVGEPAHHIEYRATVRSSAPHADVLALMQHTDTVAEIHNTLRQASKVTLTHCDVKPV